MVPLPSEDRFLLKEHKFYDSGNFKTLYPSLSDYNDADTDNGNDNWPLIKIFVIIFMLWYFVRGRKHTHRPW